MGQWKCAKYAWRGARRRGRGGAAGCWLLTMVMMVVVLGGVVRWGDDAWELGAGDPVTGSERPAQRCVGSREPEPEVSRDATGPSRCEGHLASKLQCCQWLFLLENPRLLAPLPRTCSCCCTSATATLVQVAG